MSAKKKYYTNKTLHLMIKRILNMKKRTVLFLMITPFLQTGLYAASAEETEGIQESSEAQPAENPKKYSDILNDQRKAREKADANLEKAMTLPVQDAANACLREWGIAEATQETDPKSLFGVLVTQGINKTVPNSQFGYTFSEKNKPIIDDFIKVVKHWDKGLCIADVGAGKGLSALYLANEIFTILIKRHITPSSPIQICVSDLIYGNHLRNLATVVNAACRPHIQMTAQTVDLTRCHPLAAGPVDHIFAFNVFHYLPYTAWGETTRHLQANLSPDGAITITVDAACAEEGKQTSETENNMEAQRANPFHILNFALYDPQNERNGFIIKTYNPKTLFLKMLAIPDTRHGIEDIVLEGLKQHLTDYARTQNTPGDTPEFQLACHTVMQENAKNGGGREFEQLYQESIQKYREMYPTEHLTFGAGPTAIKTTVTELVEKVQKGALCVRIGNYNFTPETLREALKSTIIPQLKIQSVLEVCVTEAQTLEDLVFALNNGSRRPARKQILGIKAILTKDHTLEDQLLPEAAETENGSSTA